jgi:hypothetical protein
MTEEEFFGIVTKDALPSLRRVLMAFHKSFHAPISRPHAEVYSCDNRKTEAFTYPMRAFVLLDDAPHEMFDNFSSTVSCDYNSPALPIIWAAYGDARGLKTEADIRTTVSVVMRGLHNAAAAVELLARDWHSYGLDQAVRKLMTGKQFGKIVIEEIKARGMSEEDDADDIKNLIGPLLVAFPDHDKFGAGLHARMEPLLERLAEWD